MVRIMIDPDGEDHEIVDAGIEPLKKLGWKVKAGRPRKTEESESSPDDEDAEGEELPQPAPAAKKTAAKRPARKA